MPAIGRGQRSDCAHPVLDLYTSVDGHLVDVGALAFGIFDISTPALRTAPRPVVARVELDPAHACPDGSRLGRGHYVATWTVPEDQPLGTHEVRWWFRAAPDAPEYTFVEELEVVPFAPELPGRGYCSVADLRAEGVSDTQASDERLASLIEEASALIDRLTGWWFEPRWRSFRIEGRGTRTLEPPVPPIRLERMAFYGNEVDFRTPHEVWSIRGAPVGPDFVAPRITRDRGVFPRAAGSIELEGVWGYTEHDGTPMGRTPLAIRRACMLLVMRMLPRLGDVDALDDARNRWRVIEERTRDQSVKMAPPRREGELTGDAEIDDILARYRRPHGLGAA